MGEDKEPHRRQRRKLEQARPGGMDAGVRGQCLLKAPGGMGGSGRELVEKFYGIWQDAFPDCGVDPIVIAEGGEDGFLEAVFNGTHSGELNAPSGTIAPTGRSVSVPFVVTQKARGGKFTSFHLYFDQLELMSQLGLM